eukprot:m.85945 g.85945  ORF g.85945 m.85945 type:complete len:515 (+) comp16372_c0_seq2:119-1663(+)
MSTTFLFTAACGLVAIGQVLCKQVSISNVLPRTNVTGDIMDAHDGSYNKWSPDGPWYYYAMGYGTCKQGGDMCHGCGYGYSWIGVWKSTDMSNGSWALLHDARDDSWPHCTYFRVHVVFNAKTNLYVLWVNLNGGPADYAIGTSTTPEGPFKFVHAIDAGQRSGGDFDIFVDNDGSAYLIYTQTRTHGMQVERLTDDYLASAAVAPPPAPPPAPPSPSGFTRVGHGACRDAHMKEPPFETNEPHHKGNMSEAACAEACKSFQGCTAFAYCYGNSQCVGACHLYLSSKPTTPPASGIWTWQQGSGGVLPVNHVTDETWWDCFSADTDPTASASPGTALSAAPSNVTSGPFGNVFVEAPAMFKRSEVYYALFDNCCCFCGHGSGIGVYTAAHPLGPWLYHDNIGCTKNTTLTPGCGCGMNHAIPGGQCDFYGDSLTKAQQNFVIPIKQSDGSVQYVWTGDRWQSASDGIKAHDLQYWSVLDFATVECTDAVPGCSATGTIDLPRQFTWEDTIVISV